MFSRNIFKDIEKLIFKEHDDYLNIRDDHRMHIQAFLSKPSFDATLVLYRFIAGVHKKEWLFNLIDDLRVYEKGFKKILPKHREHYRHSASVYLLGFAIYNNCKRLRDALNTERHEPTMRHQQKTSFMFRWALAACLHDLAYPLELSLNSFNTYSSYLHEMKDCNFITIDPLIYEKFNLLPILEESNSIQPDIRKDTALGLIARCLVGNDNRYHPICHDTLLKLLEKYLTSSLAAGRVDHGIFSSIITLKRIHELYRNNSWNALDFYYEVVEASTAIFLHNSYKYSELKSIYGNGKFPYDYPSSLGFLLSVSDTLCEWLRGEKQDYDSYGLFVNDDEIVFRVPRSRVNKIQEAVMLFDTRLPIKVTDKWGNMN